MICRRGTQTGEADAARFFGSSLAACVMTIERDWLERFTTTLLSLYAFARGPHWRLHDENAGTHVSKIATTPLAEFRIRSPAEALRAREVELRVVDDLWPVIDAVAASTLAFSIIRKRNAKPRRSLD